MHRSRQSYRELIPHSLKAKLAAQLMNLSRHGRPNANRQKQASKQSNQANKAGYNSVNLYHPAERKRKRLEKYKRERSLSFPSSSSGIKSTPGAGPS